MTYEMLDSIADSYIPILAMVLLISLGMKTTIAQRFFNYLLTVFRREISNNSREEKHSLQKSECIWNSVAMVLGIIGVYAIGFFDQRFDVWLRFSLDYSTHTALALVIVAHIILIQRGKTVRWGFMLSFVAYLILMHYQRYHTFLDMFSTASVIFLMLMLIRGLQNATKNHF